MGRHVFQHLEKDILTKYSNKQHKKFWIISITEHCGIILMSLAVVSTYSLGPNGVAVM